MSQPAGWYDDPHDPTHLRYFDGVLWTENRAPKASPTIVQPPVAPSQPTPAPQYGQQQPGQQQPEQQQPEQQGPWQYGPRGERLYGQEGAQHGYTSVPTPGYAPAPAYGFAFGGKTTPDGTPLATWGQRVGAYLLDYLILVVITMIAGSYFIYQFFQWYLTIVRDLVNEAGGGVAPTVDTTTINEQVLGYLWPIVLISLVVQLAYNTYFLTRSGATPGKMALGLSVRRRERPGPLNLVEALKRQAIPLIASVVSLVPLVGTIVSFLPLLDDLWPLWDDKRQALHDKLADTNVVVTRRR